MKANNEKVSVSFPPEMIQWLKAEAKRETEETAEQVSVSRLVCRAVKAMQGKVKGSASAAFHPELQTSAGGSSTRGTARSRKAG